ALGRSSPGVRARGRRLRRQPRGGAGMTATMAPVFPSARDEAWRYTPVDEILAALEGAVPAREALVPRSVVDQLAGSHGGARMVFVNGAHAAAVSDADGVPTGVTCGCAP